jgi:hypothetical protein
MALRAAVKFQSPSHRGSSTIPKEQAVEVANREFQSPSHRGNLSDVTIEKKNGTITVNNVSIPFSSGRHSLP